MFATLTRAAGVFCFCFWHGVLKKGVFFVMFVFLVNIWSIFVNIRTYIHMCIYIYTFVLLHFCYICALHTRRALRLASSAAEHRAQPQENPGRFLSCSISISLSLSLSAVGTIARATESVHNTIFNTILWKYVISYTISI